MRYKRYFAAAALILWAAGVGLLLLNWRWRVPRYLVESSAPSTPVQRSIPRSDLLKENESLQSQIDSLRAQLETAQSQVKAVRQEIEDAGSKNVKVKAHSADLEKANTDLLQEMAERDSLIAQLRADLENNRAQIEKLTAAKGTNEFQIQIANSELKELRGQVETLTSEINERQQLSAAAEQAKDLIVARKLHIVDVDDTDGTGKQRRPFGRIFYAEGRNLVFYAYDLTDSGKINTKIDFYVWGGREGTNKPVHRLGIFRADDEKDGRWVLRFDDSTVLAQINCVFVTAESNKKPLAQPSGHQILFASLGAKPNHP